jgi:hypothetical protein
MSHEWDNIEGSEVEELTLQPLREHTFHGQVVYSDTPSAAFYERMNEQHGLMWEYEYETV